MRHNISYRKSHIASYIKELEIPAVASCIKELQIRFNFLHDLEAKYEVNYVRTKIFNQILRFGTPPVQNKPHHRKHSFKATGQTLSGKIIICDSSSSLAMTLSSSTLNSIINADNYGGTVSLTLDSSSSWNAGGVSYLTSLSDTDTAYSNIDSPYNIYVNGATSSSYTATKTLSSGGVLYLK